MKRTVSEWTRIQNRLPGVIDIPVGGVVSDPLWIKIEERTWGKSFQASVAIALSKQEEEKVAIAERSMKN
jgi:hypothetical protein